MRALRTIAAALLVAALPLAAVAESRHDGVFDIYLRGIKAAQLGFSAIEAGGRYSASGKFQTTGLVNRIRSMSYEAKSQGIFSRKDFVPAIYEETRYRNGDVGKARMEYRDGVPQGREFDPPRPPRDLAVDPATQGGTWDVMTAIYALLRPTPRDEVCALNEYLYDGTHRAQIVLGAPQQADDTILCNAEYRRIAGYKPEEMAERTVFPFRVTYEETADGTWQVSRIDMETLYGRGSMVRR